MAEERDQADVLPKKGNVTKSGIGLQQWGDEAQPDGHRTAYGTAGRQARVVKGQKDALEDDA